MCAAEPCSNIPDMTGPCDHDATHTNGVFESRCAAMLWRLVFAKAFPTPGVQTRIEKCVISSQGDTYCQLAMLLPWNDRSLMCFDV
jgi:hypothetical protein